MWRYVLVYFKQVSKAKTQFHKNVIHCQLNLLVLWKVCKTLFISCCMVGLRWTCTALYWIAMFTCVVELTKHNLSDFLQCISSLLLYKGNWCNFLWSGDVFSFLYCVQENIHTPTMEGFLVWTPSLLPFGNSVLASYRGWVSILSGTIHCSLMGAAQWHVPTSNLIETPAHKAGP